MSSTEGLREPSTNVERRLAAILSADVKGYSRLMGEDEVATVRTLTDYRELMTAQTRQHRGRVVDSPGDNVLAEFASVVDAVQCAVEIQQEFRARNAELPTHRKMEFRIGINLGDVIVEGARIYGDGVNIAARLESLAEPGGICISGTVYDQIENKLPLHYEYLGEQAVKNIAKPVRAWRVVMDGATAEAGHKISSLRAGERQREESGSSKLRWLRPARVIVAGLVLVAGALIAIRYLSHPPVNPQSPVHVVPEGPALPLPDKPSIAVLPFTNESGDHEQEYFSDGITEDLITDLSRLPGLFVIARNSSFTYKGKPTKLQDVSKELGVKYVLGGSVRKAADRVRISAQLADATTGTELWAERYDRPMRDVFAAQDEIVRRIVTTLNLEIDLAQQGIVVRRSTDSLEAYDDLLQGMGHLWSLTSSGNLKARELFGKAIQLDPQYARAYAALALNYWIGWAVGLTPNANDLDQGIYMAQRASTLDDSLSDAHSVLAAIYEQQGRTEQAVAEAQRGIALDPNSGSGYMVLAHVLNDQWKPAEALAAIEKAIRIDPRDRVNYLIQAGTAYLVLGRWQESIRLLKTFSASYPDHVWGHALLADDYLFLGDYNAAQTEEAAVERVVETHPDSAAGYWALAHVKNSLIKPAEALKAANKSLGLEPGNPRTHLEQGIAYLLLGRGQEAIPPLKSFSARYPDDFRGHTFLADGYGYLGNDGAAQTEEAAVERLTTIDPNPLRYWALAEVKGSLGKPSESLAAAQRALRLDPSNPSLLFQEGRAYSLLGRPEEAIPVLKDYVFRVPGNFWAHVWLAIDYSELGRDDAAREEVAEVVRLSADSSVERFFPTGSVRGKKFVSQVTRFRDDLRKAGLK
jgi:adenylate cyclase